MTRLTVGPFPTAAAAVSASAGTRTAIAIWIEAENGEREAVATVNVAPYGAPPARPGRVWLKGWNENAGLPEALEAAGACKRTGETCTNHQVVAELAELTSAALAALAEAEGPQP